MDQWHKTTTKMKRSWFARDNLPVVAELALAKFPMAVALVEGVPMVVAVIEVVLPMVAVVSPGIPVR